jgi:RNA polymerase sigma-70 factor (ECF subfamily)
MARDLTIQAIRRAQAGNMQNLSAVAEQVRPKVYTYIYRLTLDYHLTQDLTQETTLEMIKALPKLEVPHINGFWGWIFRTALGKVQHHFRLQGARRLAKRTTSKKSVLESHIGDQSSAADVAIRRETRNAVLGAMKAIELKYRSILVLRCFDDLSYGQIAGIMGGSELRARLLFFRAKHSLKGQLERRGFKRESLLAALTIFARLTLKNGKKATAAEVVSASSLEGGLGAGLAGLLTVRTVVAAACVLGIAGFAANRITQPDPPPTSEELYSHLYPLLGQTGFVAPSRVINVNDSDRDGFRTVNLNTPQSPAQRLNPDHLEDALLTNPYMGLVLPKDHWAELGFDGPLHDGPGPDILIVTRACRYYARVFVTDGLGQARELLRPRCLRLGVCWHKHILDFDLHGLNLPFEPRAVRVMGISNRGRVGGVELYAVRARIWKESPLPL